MRTKDINKNRRHLETSKDQEVRCHVPGVRHDLVLASFNQLQDVARRRRLMRLIRISATQRYGDLTTSVALAATEVS